MLQVAGSPASHKRLERALWIIEYQSDRIASHSHELAPLAHAKAVVSSFICVNETPLSGILQEGLWEVLPATRKKSEELGIVRVSRIAASWVYFVDNATPFRMAPTMGDLGNDRASTPADGVFRFGQFALDSRK